MKILDINGRQRLLKSIKLASGFPGYLKAELISKSNPKRTLTEWYPIQDFLKHNPQYTDKFGDSDQPEEIDKPARFSHTQPIKNQTDSTLTQEKKNK